MITRQELEELVGESMDDMGLVEACEEAGLEVIDVPPIGSVVALLSDKCQTATQKKLRFRVVSAPRRVKWDYIDRYGYASVEHRPVVVDCECTQSPAFTVQDNGKPYGIGFMFEGEKGKRYHEVGRLSKADCPRPIE